MDGEKRTPRRRNWMWIIVGAEWLVLLAVAAVLLCSCRPVRYVPVESVREHYHNTTTTDTLVVRDSVVIDRSGDTIREWRWRDRWRSYAVHDTIEHRDTIAVPYTIEVPAQLTPWERVKVSLGGWAIGAVAVLAGVLALIIRRR